MNKLRVLDLFSGIGGFSLGLERTGGFETVAFCEMKPHAQAVLAKNFPGVPCHGDVTTYEFHEGEADVITAGFPCQDLSFAGAGAGLSGSRSGLYREVIRAIRVVRPVRAVLENVAALLSRGLGTVLGDLAEIGHDAEWHCIPASSVGAPHRRDRIWIVANPRGEQHESGCAPISGSLSEGLSKAYLANTSCERGDEAGELRHFESEEWAASRGKTLADTDCDHAQRFFPGCFNKEERSGSVRGSAGSCSDGVGQWSVEPGLGRVANGVPHRVDRLEELGNAVVPQVPEIIGHAILEAIARKAEGEAA
ncbi:DNA (cytosine-5)-methyltransferase 1 [Ochrobactrum sp. 19YEA23]|uniref:DNA cytosine methyltransferase n=1 Tax=Ochrobactrum sp. 19YEA23 TaxID=3039854 RepID=UPI0024796B2C|nr:DNA (cytosine-5)-methyltransferase 1 [Ochrobactrum sp. 19YEA23]